ncbi:glycogen debranching N-terminal domain-containing protein [Streptomyces sp. NPDC051104]|uniref:glycogen debranching N-terminal domain-containing protein n=1 Tax=Streptomyces sp. NPDC051104 TaxID=3155044 RepID=UPI00341A11B5
MADEVGTIIEETEPAVLTAATVTLVEGPTFCVSGTSGDMEAEVPQGLFFRDMRVISDWQVRVDGHRPHHLTVLSQDSYSTIFVSRVPPHGLSCTPFRGVPDARVTILAKEIHQHHGSTP